MLRRLYFLALMGLAGCATTTGLEPTERFSGFDNARVVDIQPHGNACTGMVCTGFGLQWNSKYPENAFMIVEVFNDITAIFGAQLNVDGNIVTLQESQLTSDFESDGYVKNSSKAFLISMDTLRRIETAHRVWMRVETPSGTIEDAIIDGETDSKSYHALKRFLAKVDS
tara:strand:- start:715 stop:1221 length:507 start_codon:yes stop_codon:yes gene_type:complete